MGFTVVRDANIKQVHLTFKLWRIVQVNNTLLQKQIPFITIFNVNNN